MATDGSNSLHLLHLQKYAFTKSALNGGKIMMDGPSLKSSLPIDRTRPIILQYVSPPMDRRRSVKRLQEGNLTLFCSLGLLLLEHAHVIVARQSLYQRSNKPDASLILLPCQTRGSYSCSLSDNGIKTKAEHSALRTRWLRTRVDLGKEWYQGRKETLKVVPNL